MKCSEHCSAISGVFDENLARRDLDDYRRRGPSTSTRRLIAALGNRESSMQTLLDVGGGVGTIVHELLASGTATATLVDASPSYLAAAREEAERRGTTSRVEFRLGDLVHVSSDLQPAEVVTLDKVVCCYPDLETLVAVSAARSRRLYGIVYPVDGWWVRLAMAIENRLRALRGSAFRVFVHSNAAIDAALRKAGLTLRHHRRGLWWVVAVYERRDT